MQKHEGSDSASFSSPYRVDDVIVSLDGESDAIGVAAWVVPPLVESELLPAMWLLCFPGSTYRGLAYFDRQVPGSVDWAWSMVRFFAEQGIGSVIMDNVGTGESHMALSGERITRQFVACVYRQVVAQVRERLCTGTLLPERGPVPPSRLWLCGVGHSMGGYLLVQTQGTQDQGACFDGVAILGWGCHPANPLPDTGVEPEALQQGWVQRAQNGYVHDLRALLRPLLYSPDVPEDLIRADETDGTVVPLGLLIDLIQPGVSSEPAARIRCPVYLGYGAADVVPNPRMEPAAYSAAASITLFIQESAAHCANFAGSRFTLWHDLAGWCRLRAVQRKGRGAIPFASASGQQ